MCSDQLVDVPVFMEKMKNEDVTGEVFVFKECLDDAEGCGGWPQATTRSS